MRIGVRVGESVPLLERPVGEPGLLAVLEQPPGHAPKAVPQRVPIRLHPSALLGGPLHAHAQEEVRHARKLVGLRQQPPSPPSPSTAELHEEPDETQGRTETVDEPQCERGFAQPLHTLLDIELLVRRQPLRHPPDQFLHPGLHRRQPGQRPLRLGGQEGELVRAGLQRSGRVRGDADGQVGRGLHRQVRGAVQHVGHAGTFGQKLDALMARRLISSVDRERLEVVIEAGNAATHRGHVPAAQAVHQLMDCVEHLLQGMYAFQEPLRAIQRAIPKRR